jgi:cell division transport system permease protein
MVGDRPGAFLLATALASLALALPLTLASIGWAVWPIAERVQPAAELSVFVAPRATAREVDTLKDRLAQRPGVVAVRLQPKDVALAELAKQAGFGTLPAELGANPLPDVLFAQLAPTIAPASLEALVAETRAWPLVDAVRSDLDWYRKVRAVAKVLGVATALFGGIAMVLVALVLLGTVRLHAAARADEIAVLTLSGATPRFIVRPYAYSAALTLLVAAAVATVLLYAVHAALRRPVAELAGHYGSQFALGGPEPVQLAAFWIFAGTVGWLIGWIGVRASAVR